MAKHAIKLNGRPPHTIDNDVLCHDCHLRPDSAKITGIAVLKVGAPSAIKRMSSTPCHRHIRTILPSFEYRPGTSRSPSNCLSSTHSHSIGSMPHERVLTRQLPPRLCKPSPSALSRSCTFIFLFIDNVLDRPTHSQTTLSRHERITSTPLTLARKRIEVKRPPSRTLRHGRLPSPVLPLGKNLDAPNGPLRFYAKTRQSDDTSSSRRGYSGK